jgi:hypothetical protein
VAKLDDTFGTNGYYQGFDPLGFRPEKPCSVEVINPDGSSGFQIDAGISVHGGGSSRSTMKHPLNLKFRGIYGAGKLNYQFFPDSPVTEFDSLVLRSDYNNHWTHGDVTQRSRGGLVRDAFFKDVQTAMGDFSSHSSYVHLYINGLYWGVYNPCDDLDNNFAAAYLGGSDADYDVVKASTGILVVDGNTIALNAMQALNNSGLSNLSQYNQIQQYLDIAQYADYFILQSWGGNQDWNQTANWSALRVRQPGAGFKFMCWDSERTLEGINDVANQAGPLGLQANLAGNAEYRLAFADRVHKHFFNNGALTTNTVMRLWNERAAQIQAAIVGESARWGDVVPNGKGVITPLPYPSYDTNTPYYSRNENFLGEQGRLMTNYFPLRSAIMLDRFRSAGLYPLLDAPEFNQNGGRVSAGFSLTISAPVGTIYFTTNGTDPRVYGTGAVSPQAASFSGPVTLNNSMTVKARALNGSTWSALCEADFTVAEIGSPLRITEIMYNPIGGNNYEFIEVQNTGSDPLDVGSFTFQGITYTFPANAIIPPGGVVLLANSGSPSAFASRYPGAVVFGYFSGNLANGGERIAILDRNGQTVTAVHYDNGNGWPAAADGGGYSIEVIDPLGDPNAPANWRASAALNGTPGLPPAAPPALGNIVLSEIMADNVSTITNGGTLPDWVELQNRGVSAVNLANWSLSDDSNPRKFVFPANTILNGESYLVVWCDSATNAPGLHTGFALGKSGDNVFLYDTATNRMDAVTFGLQLSDYSIGRIGNDWQLNTPTPNADNIAATLASPTNVSINEWMAASLPGTEDWIELFNRSSNAPVEIGNLYLGTSNALFQISSLSFLGARQFVQMFADENAGADHLEFKLPGSGSAITLYDNTGVPLDSIIYGAQTDGVSEGRLPDGSATIVDFPGSASPGGTNYLLAWTGPVLNEILARNNRAVIAPWGDAADWVELYNPGGTDADLSGMGLKDSPSANNRWLFPTGTTIPAGGYLLVWCDSSRAASTNNSAALNSGFSLNGDSGDVYLFNTAGQPVDSVSYGFQISDQSIGRSGGAWQLLDSPTPGAANSAPAALGTITSLRVNEWMASPTNGNDWFEIYNTNSLPVNLGGLYLTDDPSTIGITNFQTAPLSFIAGRGWVEWQADGSLSSGHNHTDFSLDSLGETLRIYDTNLTPIDVVDFGIQSDNVSQGRLPDGGTNIMSFPTSPTPDDANYLPVTNIVINEILTHTDPPIEDAIEFYNPSGSAVDIGGWYLSDSASDPKRFRVPDGTTIPAGGFKVFYQYQFGPPDGETDTPPLFTFNSAHGDSAYLSEADANGNLTGYRVGISFDAAAHGVSFGRYQTSVGVDFVAMSQTTFGMDNPTTLAEFRTGTGATNAYPLVGPVVINEIMYHPPDLLTNFPDTEEYIELFNLSNAPVALYDPAAPTNVWRLANAVTFDFPTGTTIPANGYLIVVAFDPATDTAALANFHARFGTNGTLVGPYSGKLNNAGETVELWRPDEPQAAPHPDAGFVPQILVERVAYSDNAPWPVAADGGGASLQRVVPANYGNDPANWYATSPSAGLPHAVDTDGDGMPDDWEIANGTDPFVNDADADPDHDGLSNFQEYLAGTSPTNSASVFRIESALMSGTNVIFSFTAISNHSYTVQIQSALGSGAWQKWLNIPSAPGNRTIWLTNGAGIGTNSFYRLATPLQP